MSEQAIAVPERIERRERPMAIAGSSMPELLRDAIARGERLACHIDFKDYIFSSSGEVISLKNCPPRILRGGKVGKYLGVFLGRNHRFYVHRLIAEIFLGPPKEGYEVCHGDGDPLNNAAENLRWDTRSGNHRDKLKHGTATIGEQHPGAKLDEQRVRLMRRLHECGISPAFSMKYFRISRMQHWRIVNRKLWTHI